MDRANEGLSTEAKVGVFGVSALATIEPLGIIGAAVVGTVTTWAANKVYQTLN